MCQLLGMNCNVATDATFSFRGFSARGGRTGEHKDGWGIAFFEGTRGCRLFTDCLPSCESPLADLVRQYPIKSLNVIAHIRKATKGPVCLENTHPFMREMWGRYFVFAHNGTLESYPEAPGTRYQPVGSTDSERAFCALLERLAAKFGDVAPELAALHDEVKDFAAETARYGPFNFLLTNGEFLMAHCSTNLSYVTRKAPFTKVHLVDEDVEVDFSRETSVNDRVAVVATVPLTSNEEWKTLKAGDFVTFQHGQAVLNGAVLPS